VEKMICGTAKQVLNLELNMRSEKQALSVIEGKKYIEPAVLYKKYEGEKG
jgi:hypothetical protein